MFRRRARPKEKGLDEENQGVLNMKRMKCWTEARRFYQDVQGSNVTRALDLKHGWCPDLNFIER